MAKKEGQLLTPLLSKEEGGGEKVAEEGALEWEQETMDLLVFFPETII